MQESNEQREGRKKGQKSEKRRRKESKKFSRIEISQTVILLVWRLDDRPERKNCSRDPFG